jgi:hypothetical protein
MRDWQSLPEPERLLVAVGELRARVNIGGFDKSFLTLRAITPAMPALRISRGGWGDGGE